MASTNRHGHDSRYSAYTGGPDPLAPPVDLHETPDEYVVTAELPGLTNHDVDVRYEDGRLTIAGQRRETRVPSGQYHRVERGHGTFSRTFQLPLPIESDGISADLRDGVLTVRCRKSSEGARRIRIS